MTASAHDTLKNVLTQLFESWAMMFSEDTQDVYGVNQMQLYHTQIHFHGPHHGKLNLWVSENMSETLVTNIMGLYDTGEIDEKDKVDVVKELANLACGHFLSTYYGEDKEFFLGIPNITQNTVAPPALQEKVQITVDGIQIVADVQIDA